MLRPTITRAPECAGWRALRGLVRMQLWPAPAPVDWIVRVRWLLAGGPANVDGNADYAIAAATATEWRTDLCEVLVVDDDIAILESIAQTLEFEGYRVVTAVNGVEALRRLDERMPNVILLDMRMPVMDGWAFAKAARDRGVPARIVVMTATTDVRRWATEIGADGYLGKPFDLTALLDVVKRSCQGGDG